MHVLALAIDLHLPQSRSLKAKRSVLRSVVDTCRRRYRVAVAETDHQDTWQRTQLGIVTVAESPAHCVEVIDEVERFIWSVPETQVIGSSRHWLEMDE